MIFIISGKNLTELCLCSSVLRNREHASNEIGHLGEEISKQIVEIMLGCS